MTRRFRRHDSFEVTLQITSDDFIRPPREAQRNWLLNRALTELTDELVHLDDVSRRFVPGRSHAELRDRSSEALADDEIMEDWQIPVMEAMARIVTAAGGDVLEIGFGRGVSASRIQEAGVRSHTIVECNADVIERYHRWRGQYPGRDIRLIEGRWQDTVDQLATYDGIFFHTYPLDEQEYVEHVVRSVTFAGHFFATAAAHLRAGGVFTYLTNEIDSFSRAHQRLVLRHFRELTLSVVAPLELPEDSRDDLWGDSMVIAKAVR
jgi:guanidinoacetate N-methyltransferase